MPAVSVIIPTYKHRDYVLETLESVFAQTFVDFEVIVINDGSPDDTAALLRPIGATGRIRYVEQTNAGQAAARNRGLSMATGEFIAFLDDDDRWRPDHLAWQVEILRAEPDVVAVGGKFRMLIGDTPEHTTESDARGVLLPAGFYRHNPFFSPGQVLIRGSVLHEVGGFDPDIWGTDDLDLWIRLAARGPLVWLDRVALDYRRHAGNASHAWRRMLSNGRRTLQKNLPLLPEAERAAALRDGERYLYFCNGSNAVQAAWSWQPSRWHEAAAAIGSFIGPALKQPGLAVAIARDCVPKAIRSALHN